MNRPLPVFRRDEIPRDKAYCLPDGARDGDGRRVLEPGIYARTDDPRTDDELREAFRDQVGGRR